MRKAIIPSRRRFLFWKESNASYQLRLTEYAEKFLRHSVESAINRHVAMSAVESIKIVLKTPVEKVELDFKIIVGES